jgi:hypothetical protein
MIETISKRNKIRKIDDRPTIQIPLPAMVLRGSVTLFKEQEYYHEPTEVRYVKTRPNPVELFRRKKDKNNN